MSGSEECPVCLWPARPDAPCRRCGVAPSDVEDTTRLADRQHAYDLDAAVRAAASVTSPDQVLLSWLGANLRGKTLSADQIKEAMSNARQPAPTTAGTVFAMIRLVAGKTSAVAFVEIGPDLVSWQILVADESGVPVPVKGESREWTAILPALPVHMGLRYLRMAGGVGRPAATQPQAPSAAVLTAAVSEHIEPELRRFASAAAAEAALYRASLSSDDSDGEDPPRNPADGSPSLDTVLVLRTQDWPLLDAAAEQARAMMRPVAVIMAEPDTEALNDVVQAVASLAPLRYSYELITVDANTRTGVVQPRAYELFPSGAAGPPGNPLGKTVAVSPVRGHAARQLVLPIVARRGPITDLRDIKALEEHRSLIATARLPEVTEGTFRLRLELGGLEQERMRLSAPTEFLLTSDVPGDWPAVIADLPEQLWAPPRLTAGSLDLVLLVELGGAKSKRGRDVAARIRLVKGVVDEFRGVPEVRIALLGYRDHGSLHERHLIGVPGREDRALVVGSTGGFATPEDVRWRLEQKEWWSAVPIRDDYAAPIEDALWLIAKDTWNWRPDARHAVIILGRRPPHPAKEQPSYLALACRHKNTVWEEDLERLRTKQAVQFFAVPDHDPLPGYAADAWRTLAGAAPVQAARGVTARTLAEQCGLAPRSPELISLAALAGAAPSPARSWEGVR